MAARLSALAAGLAILYGGILSSERVSRASLHDRLVRFYAAQKGSSSSVQTSERADRALSKYGTEAEIEAALRRKYGKGLPPEDLRPLYTSDLAGTVAHRLHSAISSAVAPHVSCARPPEWLTRASQGARRMAWAAAGRWSGKWADWNATQRAAASVVAWAAARLALPSSARVPALISLFTAVALGVRPPPPGEQAASHAIAELGAWFGDAGPLGRVGMLSGIALVLVALSGARHAMPLLLAWLVATAALTRPAPSSIAQMDFVHASARPFVSAAMAGDDPLLRAHDFGLFTAIALRPQQPGDSEWAAPVHSIGALGQWSTIAQLHVPSTKKLELRGPAIVPLLLLPSFGCFLALAASIPARDCRRAHRADLAPWLVLVGLAGGSLAAALYRDAV